MWPGNVELAFREGRLQMKMAKYYVTDLVINDEKGKKGVLKRGQKNGLNFQWNRYCTHRCADSEMNVWEVAVKKRKLMCETYYKCIAQK